MTIIHVHVQVLSDRVAEFKEATVVNARRSQEEPGVARFDVLQQEDDPTCFVLAEAYHSLEAVSAHKETEHYRLWRDAVEPMMAESRLSVKYVNVFPHAEGW
jgi:quinol monooxygenase YgiN